MRRAPPWTEGGRPAPPEAWIEPDRAARNVGDFQRLRRRLLWSWRGWGHFGVSVVVTVRRPTMFLIRLFGRLRTAAPVVRRTHGVPVLRQALDMVRLFVRWGLHPTDYYQDRLYEPGRMHTARFQIHPFHNAEIFGGFLRWGTFPWDKLRFDARARAAGLPVIPILASCPPGGEPTVHLPDSHHWAGDLFSKRVAGGRGESQRRWRRLPGGGLGDGIDRVASVEDLLQLLCHVKHPRFASAEIVQPCVRNHPDILAVTTGGLSTLRIHTVQRAGGRPPEVLLPLAKFVVGDCPVDNMGKGNVVAPVELATGRVGTPWRVRPTGLVERVETHPDSGRPIRGLVLPDWQRALDLCRRGQTVFDEVPSIGWDVAPTPDGPVLVEANIMWAASDYHDWPQGLTPYPRWMVDWIEEARARGAGAGLARRTGFR